MKLQPKPLVSESHRKLYVKGFSKKENFKTLTEFFGPFGVVKKCETKFNGHERYAYVSFEKEDSISMVLNYATQNPIILN